MKKSREGKIGEKLRKYFHEAHHFSTLCFSSNLILLVCVYYVFGTSRKFQLICNFRLFLLLFMDSTVLFGTIHRSYCTI